MKVQQKTNRLPKDNELSFFLLKNCPSLADEFPGFSFTCLHGVFRGGLRRSEERKALNQGTAGFLIKCGQNKLD